MEELLAKYFSEEASADERKEVEQWRADSEENAQAFLDYKKVWVDSQKNSKEVNPEMLDNILGESEPTFEVVPLWNQRLFRVAAALILAMGVVFVILNRSIEQPFGQVLTENTEFKLPDGSKVLVQKGGMLTLGSFEDSREVILSGKGYFDVDRDEDHPFIVQTKSALVEVLGTSFVVRSSGAEELTEVQVESGKVALSFNPVAFNGKTMSVNLEKGEMGELEIGKAGIRKKKINDDNYLSWTTGVISFRRESLMVVSKTLEDVYGMEIKFENPALRNCRLTASFKEKTIEEVVKIISETFTIEGTIEGNVVTFSGESCS